MNVLRFSSADAALQRLANILGRRVKVVKNMRHALDPLDLFFVKRLFNGCHVFSNPFRQHAPEFLSQELQSAFLNADLRERADHVVIDDQGRPLLFVHDNREFFSGTGDRLDRASGWQLDTVYAYLFTDKNGKEYTPSDENAVPFVKDGVTKVLVLTGGHMYEPLKKFTSQFGGVTKTAGEPLRLRDLSPFDQFYLFGSSDKTRYVVVELPEGDTFFKKMTGDNHVPVVPRDHVRDLRFMRKDTRVVKAVTRDDQNVSLMSF